MKDPAAARGPGSFAASRTMGESNCVLPIDAIEAGRCFVADLQIRPVRAADVSTIVAKPNAQCLRTIMEAEQTAEQVDTLGQRGRAWMQGAHYFQPRLADRFMRLAGLLSGASICAGLRRFCPPERARVGRQP